MKSAEDMEAGWPVRLFVAFVATAPHNRPATLFPPISLSLGVPPARSSSSDTRTFEIS
jgi:hypothetical protein